MSDDQKTGAHPMLLALGRELKIARERHGITQQDLAKEIHFSDSQISAIETGRRPASLDLLHRADDVLNTGGILGRLHGTAQETASREIMPEWFRPWREIEETATALRSYQPLVIDGMLQTPAYARALLRAGTPTASEETLQIAVKTRLHRQQVLTRKEPPRMITIIEETVLHRPVGDSPQVMREQLEALITASRTARAEVHILPAEIGAHRGLSGGFVLASLPDAPDVAYLETQLRGLVIETTPEVDAARRTWEGLLGEALPKRQSVELIKGAAESWKT